MVLLPRKTVAYRILKPVADTYITSKYVGGSRSFDANVGMAGTTDLYKLYGESVTTSSVELSRGLIRFDLGPLMAATASNRLDLRDGTFRCYLHLRDVYGGQATPSEFTLSLFPLARSWQEGVGRDVVAYRDLGQANFLTASITGGTPVLWAMSGAGQTGSLGDSAADYYVSGNLGVGSQSLESTQRFVTGDEDLYIDVTAVVSGTLKGQIPDYGWRLSFLKAEEDDQTTRWVKRFGTRHTQDKWFRPRVVATWDDSLRDNNTQGWFEVGSDVVLYTRRGGQVANLKSGSVDITGSNSLLLDLVASRSVMVMTTSWSQTHSQSIQHPTSSVDYYRVGVTASQVKTGVYRAPVTVSLTDPALVTFLDGGSSVTFETFWRSLDRQVLFQRGYWVPWASTEGSPEVLPERRYVINVTNLQDEYGSGDVAVLRVFIQDNAAVPTISRLPAPPKSAVLPRVWWRIVEAYTRKEVVPFHDPGTVLSSDAGGMTFTLWMQDLFPGTVYDLEFRGQDLLGQEVMFLLNNGGFRFKVVT